MYMKKIKNKFAGILAIALFFGMLFSAVQPLKVTAAVDVNMYVERVFWGTPPNNVQIVSPGDRNVPLTVIIHNNSNNTLRGVVGVLDLVYPFRDTSTEGNKSRAEGQPIQAGDVFNQTGDILPSGSFSLTFNLDIDDDAVKGTYEMNLTVTYNVQVNGTFYIGQPKNFVIRVVLNNQPPIIYSYNPTANPVNLIVGETADFQVKARDPDNDTITVEWVYDGETIGYGENLTFKANESEVGVHTLEVQVSDGNLTTTNTWTININRRVDTDVTLSTQYLFAGKINDLTLNITNNVWYGTVTVTITAPQQIAILNDTTYTFENMTKGDVITINFKVYVPEGLIGQTGALSVTITYRDKNGNNYNENYNIALAVRGIITMKIYDITITPTPVKPGDRVSISGTLLNTGNVLAKFTNITLLTLDVVVPELEVYTYIGDVDANSPTPFTFNVYVKANVTPGLYSLKFLVQYYDDLYEPHSFTFSVRLYIVEPENNQTSTSGGEGEYNIGWIYFATTLLIIAVLGAAYIKKRGA